MPIDLRRRSAVLINADGAMASTGFVMMALSRIGASVRAVRKSSAGPNSPIHQFTNPPILKVPEVRHGRRQSSRPCTFFTGNSWPPLATHMLRT